MHQSGHHTIRDRDEPARRLGDRPGRSLAVTDRSRFRRPRAHDSRMLARSSCFGATPFAWSREAFGVDFRGGPGGTIPAADAARGWSPDVRRRRQAW